MDSVQRCSQERRGERESRVLDFFAFARRCASRQLLTAAGGRERLVAPRLPEPTLAVPSPTPSLYEAARSVGTDGAASILWVFARPAAQRLFRLESFGSFLHDRTLLLRLGGHAADAAPARLVFPSPPGRSLAHAVSVTERMWRARPTGELTRPLRVNEALATLTSADASFVPAESPAALLASDAVASDAAPAASGARLLRGPSLAELLDPAAPAPLPPQRHDRHGHRPRAGASAARRRRKSAGRAAGLLPVRGLEADHAVADAEPPGYRARIDITEAMIDALPQAALLFSLGDGALLRANAQAERLLGRPLPAGGGFFLRHLQFCRLDGEELPAARHPLARALADETIDAEEAAVRAGEARITPIELSLRRLTLEGEEALLVTATDISARKVRERMRAEVTAMIAHDMRTPLHSILLQLDALQLRPDSDSLPRAALDRVRRNGRRLGRMIEDLLDAARIENGRLNLELETVELGQVVAELIGQIAPGLGSRILLVDPRPGTPPATVDVLRLQQVLTNLIENAAKYSPSETPIEVLVEPYAGGTRVAVKDHGDGIAPSQIPLVFERFFQLETRQKRNGLGLGLYICRGLVLAQKGRIWLESSVGQGTTFSVWFPGASTQT